ncbi:MAG: hypothetical protein J6R42_04235 [Clostridia bacterium]|nr:hypothetical protein [Clostridia bacterium]
MKSKKIQQNPYQTNKGGKIKAPFAPTGEPSSQKQVGKGDLRDKKK